MTRVLSHSRYLIICKLRVYLLASSHACACARVCLQKAFVGDALLFCPSQLFFFSCNINIKKNEYLSAVQGCVLWDRESGESAVCVDERKDRGN